MTENNPTERQPSRFEIMSLGTLNTLRATYPAAIAAAAIVGFFIQPAIRFIDIGEAWPGALACAGSIILLAFTSQRHDSVVAVVGYIGAIFGAGLLLNSLDTATKLYWENDQRCVQVEMQMLSAVRTRQDLPELFSALGCVPKTKLRLPAAPAPKVSPRA